MLFCIISSNAQPATWSRDSLQSAVLQHVLDAGIKLRTQDIQPFLIGLALRWMVLPTIGQCNCSEHFHGGLG